MKNTMQIAPLFLATPSSSPRFQMRSLLLIAATFLLLLLAQSTTFAGSATWKTNPGSGDWNTATNWMPNTVPNGATDTATFANSNTTTVSFSADTEVNSIFFNAGASAFTITTNLITTGPEVLLTISGVGITNGSGITQNFVVAGDGRIKSGVVIRFTNSATAGSGTFFTINDRVGDVGVQFVDTATAGDGTFINKGGASFFAVGGSTIFLDSSTAGNGTFINNAATDSTAGPGLTGIGSTATAGNATLIGNGGVGGVFSGGSIILFGNSTGGTARVKVFGNGNLDISSHDSGVTVGSIEGDGNIFLGARKLTVGSNDLNTVFSGVIQDGGRRGGTGGRLTKIGRSKLVFSHRNLYTGGTIIKGGKLVVNNSGGSGAGSGPVQVEHGKLGGKGTIAGAVTVGTGSGPGAVLSPGFLHGTHSPGALTIQKPLTFNSDATYEVELNSSSLTADEVVANGVTIKSGAQFSFVDHGSGTLTPGTIFTVIDNTSATPIAGTFSNLPDGSIFSNNGNTYKANYDGGTGNDLTLTVVP